MRQAHLMSCMLFFLVVAVQPAWAGEAVPAPAILVSGRAEKKIPADRATVHIAVETRADTASAAGAENARMQERVTGVLEQRGVDPKHITTAGYFVAQDWRGGRGEQSKPEGYITRNTILVEVTQLDRIGALIDAALAAGANRIDAIEFTASAIAEARRAVLASAIANARADAEVMAKAAGGSLGPLIELSTERPQQPLPLRASVMPTLTASGGGAQTQITPREILVEAVVFGRWQFSPSRQ
jgi:uncharacterized protein YggE